MSHKTSKLLTGHQPHWVNIVLRAIVAMVGGHVLATLCVSLFSLLPMPPVEALLTATLSSALIYTLALFWGFSTRTITHAWVGMSLPTAALGLTAWLIMPVS